MKSDDQMWRGELSDYWMEDGILYGLSKESQRTIEKLQKDFSLVRKITNNKKVCFILDNTHTKSYDILTLRYSISEIPKIYKAIAFVSRSSAGKMVSDIFTQLYSTEALPVQTFEHISPAKVWIRQYNGGFGYTFSVPD